MFRFIRLSLVSIAAAAVVAAASNVFAVADAGAKMRADFSGRGIVSSPSYFSGQTVARSAPVLATPGATERRALSFDPAQPAVPPATTAKKDADKANIAKKDAPTTRSFSYEPAPQTNNYRAPSRSSSTPLYLLPKGDSGRYGR